MGMLSIGAHIAAPIQLNVKFWLRANNWIYTDDLGADNSVSVRLDLAQFEGENVLISSTYEKKNKNEEEKEIGVILFTSSLHFTAP
jgi:hypothetical protein